MRYEERKDITVLEKSRDDRKRKCEDDRITRQREGEEKSKRDTVGGHREQIARGPGKKGDNWQHFDTTKARSTLLLNKNQVAARGVAG